MWTHIMRTAFLGILIVLKGEICTSEYKFDGEIRHFAVANGTVFVATDSQLHQIRHDLVEGKSKDIYNSTHQNALNILLPFESNGTLITCVTCVTCECGYCEILNISDITQTIYKEMNLPFVPGVGESSVTFLVNYTARGSKGTYILVAKEHVKAPGCDVTEDAVTLRNTLQSQPGEIFSKTDEAAGASIRITGVKWIDGFQIPSGPTFMSYLFANVIFSAKEKVLLLTMNNTRKTDMMRNPKVATLKCCEDQPRKRLVSSAFIPSESSLLWMGIFTGENALHPENTVLAVYNITDIRLSGPPDEFICSPACSTKQV